MRALIRRLRATFGRPALSETDAAIGRVVWHASAGMTADIDRHIYGACYVDGHDCGPMPEPGTPQRTDTCGRAGCRTVRVCKPDGSCRFSEPELRGLAAFLDR